jgi:hypothetical protein
MDSAYATDAYECSVIIIDSPSSSSCYWQIFWFNYRNYASFANGINRVNPTWSYMVYMYYRGKYHQYISEPSSGSGISDDFLQVIDNIILTIDG